jgi:sulfotransferase
MGEEYTMKTYHFLSGLPRSGNTLLSSILNQNPEIYSSPLSPICSYMWDLHKIIEQKENNLRNDFSSNNISMVNGLFNNFYYDVDKPIIFDREKSWGVSSNLEMLKKYITPTPKIVFTIRPIVEILASFISLFPSDQLCYIDEDMANDNWWYKNYLSRNDNRCDYLMRPFGMIDHAMLTFNEINKEENKNIFHIIEYDNLILKPDETLNSLYSFVGLQPYEHNLSSITKIEKDSDSIVGLPSNLHNIRKELKKISISPEIILSDYVLSKYGNIKFGVIDEK